MCLALCNPMDHSLPGSSVHGILQARILAFLSPGGLPNPGIELWSPVLQADSLPSEPNKAMLKILQARLQPYVNRELPDTQVGFRKGRGIRDQIANIRWITEKAREFQKNIYFCFIDYAKAFDCVHHNKLENSERDENNRPPDLPLEKPVCRSGSNS